MDDFSKYNYVVDKLKNRMPFGLFEQNQTCYFQDGDKVRYSHLWIALKILFGEEIRHKRLREICPDMFEGSFPYAFAKHSWKRKG